MSDFNLECDAANDWRSEASAANPAGELFAGGQFAEADIVSDNPSMTLSTITACCYC